MPPTMNRDAIDDTGVHDVSRGAGGDPSLQGKPRIAKPMDAPTEERPRPTNPQVTEPSRDLGAEGAAVVAIGGTTRDRRATVVLGAGSDANRPIVTPRSNRDAEIARGSAYFSPDPIISPRIDALIGVASRPPMNSRRQA